jgi:hypothetical protein
MLFLDRRTHEGSLENLFLNCGLNAPVGTGLYALQSKPFWGLPNDFLAIRSENLQDRTNETYITRCWTFEDCLRIV